MGIVSLEEAMGPSCVFLSFPLLSFETLHIKGSTKINCGKYNANKNPRGSRKLFYLKSRRTCTYLIVNSQLPSPQAWHMVDAQ